MQKPPIPHHLHGAHLAQVTCETEKSPLTGRPASILLHLTLFSRHQLRGPRKWKSGHVTILKFLDDSPFLMSKSQAPYDAYMDGSDLLLPNTSSASHCLPIVPPTYQMWPCLRTFAHTISTVWNALPPVWMWLTSFRLCSDKPLVVTLLKVSHCHLYPRAAHPFSCLFFSLSLIT